MDHGLAIETRVREGLLRLAKDLAIPLIATNDSHYVSQADAHSHEHLLCVNSGSDDDRPATRKRFSSTATATTSSPPRRCARCGATCQRPATTRC